VSHHSRRKARFAANFAFQLRPPIEEKALRVRRKARFDGAFAACIRRGEEKITPKTFFQVLREIEQERMQRTIELRAKVVEGTLQFEPSPDLTIHNNEIIVGNPMFPRKEGKFEIRDSDRRQSVSGSGRSTSRR